MEIIQIENGKRARILTTRPVQAGEELQTHTINANGAMVFMRILTMSRIFK